MKRLANWMMAALLALAAGMAGAADVPLGAGDVLKISVYGNPDLGLETRVSEAGQITFPLVGAVDVGGLSASAAEKKLGGLLESGGYLRKAQVNIIVTSLQSQQVSVLGQVNRPGRYPLEGKRSRDGHAGHGRRHESRRRRPGQPDPQARRQAPRAKWSTSSTSCAMAT